VPVPEFGCTPGLDLSSQDVACCCRDLTRVLPNDLIRALSHSDGPFGVLAECEVPNELSDYTIEGDRHSKFPQLLSVGPDALLTRDAGSPIQPF
jgi:hypothetical protein